jgi:YfiH family protein
MTHCFSTRVGGVSTGECTSLNFGFNRNDSRENVLENYKRIADVLKIDYRNMVFSNQVHDSRIKIVDEADRGKGIVKESDIVGYDGLVTDRKNVALVTFYADCVPLLFFEPEKRVIASSHSGWRGTVKKIGCETVRVMEQSFGCDIKKIEAAIGPSIGSCCFEVGNEVYDEFAKAFGWIENFSEKVGSDKWKLDLQSIIRRTLVECGMDEDKICMGNLCTMCNTGIFFSHRGDKGKTGSLTAIMQLK